MPRILQLYAFQYQLVSAGLGGFASFAAGAIAGADAVAAGTLLYNTNLLGLGGGDRQPANGAYSGLCIGSGALVGKGNPTTQLKVSAYNPNQYLAALFSAKVTNEVASAQLSAPGSLGT